MIYNKLKKVFKKYPTIFPVIADLFENNILLDIVLKTIFVSAFSHPVP